MAAINSEVGAIDVRTIRARDIDIDELHRLDPVPGVEADLGTSTAVTLTTNQVLSGFLSSNGGSAVTYTMPTAAALVAALKSAKVGERLFFSVNQRGAGTGVFSGAATGVTYRGTVVVAAGGTRICSILITNVTAASEAYTVYA